MQNRTPAPPALSASSAIPVICDICRAQGAAGEARFAELGDLLAFAPVPRRKKRVDGWDAERQRAFIVALAYTGSKRRAAHAVGRAQFGVDQLLRSPGAEGFRAACERAEEIAQETGRARLAAGIDQVAGQAAAWAPRPDAWSHARSRAAAPPPAPAEAEPEEQTKQWLHDLIRNYLLKVEAERRCRLAGKIVEADFYLRQMTWLEVMLDLGSGDGFQALVDFRKDGHTLVEIAETPFSRTLGAARRQKWAEMADPPRPDHPPRHRLVDHGGYSTAPVEHTQGGLAESHEQQRARFEEQHKQDAAEQLRWEAAARRDHERRRAASPLVEEEPGSAGRRGAPANGANSSDVTD